MLAALSVVVDSATDVSSRFWDSVVVTSLNVFGGRRNLWGRFEGRSLSIWVNVEEQPLVEIWGKKPFDLGGCLRTR